MAKKVGILGKGEVGIALAEGFRKKGHEVRIAGRAELASVADFGEILVLAVKGTAAVAALQAAGSSSLAGKVVIDATNPIADEPPEGGILRFFTGPNDSLMERLQAAHPAARFVKAFNSVGSSLMVEPKLAGGRPTMFVCGNDADAKREVTAILDAFGWDAEDIGGAEGARAIEPLCQLWCAPGFLRNDWRHAFKVLRP